MPIDFESLPLRELRKGRELAWDPHQIDMSRDAEDWLKLSSGERDILLRQVVGFLIGERAVAHDLAPLQQALRREKGRMEEEMYLTQQMYEESVHVEFFQRWINEALPGVLGRDIPFPPLEGNFFSDILPEALQALNTDRSPRAQMRAVVVYHQTIEGMLAEIGYSVFYQCFEARGILPGLEEGVRNIQRDEARHIAFGTYLAQRLILENPELEAVFDEEMERMHPLVLDSVSRLFGVTEGEMPFGLNRAEFDKIAEDLYQGRSMAVKRGALVRG